MDLQTRIKEIREHLSDTDDMAVLTDWHQSLAADKAWYGAELAKLKQARGPKRLEIKKRLIQENGKATESEVEGEYYATEEGQWDAYYTELLRHISPLIEAVKIKRQALSQPTITGGYN